MVLVLCYIFVFGVGYKKNCRASVSKTKAYVCIQNEKNLSGQKREESYGLLLVRA